MAKIYRLYPKNRSITIEDFGKLVKKCDRLITQQIDSTRSSVARGILKEIHFCAYFNPGFRQQTFFQLERFAQELSACNL